VEGHDQNFILRFAPNMCTRYSFRCRDTGATAHHRRLNNVGLLFFDL